jgi:hypothetical protein
MLKRRFTSAFFLMAMAATVCFAQSVTSAHSGTLHYFEGDVSIDGVSVHAAVGKFPEIKEQGVLRTGKGRAEVLLTPGVFLRIGENSAIKMLDNRLVSTRVEILEGNAVVESDDPMMSLKQSPVALIYKDYEIRMVKHGLIEISSEPAQVKVFEGQAQVVAADNHVVVKDGHLLPFSAALNTEKFNDRVGDDLFLWARDRSQNLSVASMSSARSLNSGNSAYSYGSSTPGNWNGGWYFNPYFNMFTFVPVGGTFFNSWGYGFFSPATIYNYYEPSGYWYGGGGPRAGSSIGRPISGINPSTTQAAPLSQLQRGRAPGGSLPALGSPIRGGGVISSPNTGMDMGAYGGGGGMRGGGNVSSGAGQISGGGGTPASAGVASPSVHSAGGSRGR